MASVSDTTNSTNLSFVDTSTDFATNSSSVNTSCFTLREVGYTPSMDPGNLVSADLELDLRRVKDGIVLPVLFLVGTPANLVNMAVFLKQYPVSLMLSAELFYAGRLYKLQGLKERINVCLFALAGVDFLNLLTTAIIRGDLMFRMDWKGSLGQVQAFMFDNQLGGLLGFTYSSQVTSAIIASERCFCILRPLQAQRSLRTSATVVLLLVVNFLCVGLYFLVMARYQVSCLYNQATGLQSQTLVNSDFYLGLRQLVDVLDGVVFLAVLPLFTIAVVVVTTIITANRLRKAALWRAEVSSRGAEMTSQELAVTRMLVYHSILFIIFNMPCVIFGVSTVVFPDLSYGRGQHNLFRVGIWLLDIFGCGNSTFSFFIYYAMGSRFRATLADMFACRRAAAKGIVRENGTMTTTMASPAYVIAADDRF